MKYLKVMDGDKSNAGDFVYKLNEVNVASNWNPQSLEPEEMGGFNFSTDEKILRWLHRGDTIYDVIIPDGAEVIDCSGSSCPKGVFRTNKIMISNPKTITDNIVIDLYKKSNLPSKTYYQCLVVLLYRNHLEAVKYIIKDRINKNNIIECMDEFEKFISNKHDGIQHNFSYDELWPQAKEVYNLLTNIRDS